MDIDEYQDGTSDHIYVRIKLSRFELMALEAEDVERLVSLLRGYLQGLARLNRPIRARQGYDAEATVTDEANSLPDKLTPRGMLPPGFGLHIDATDPDA